MTLPIEEAVQVTPPRRRGKSRLCACPSVEPLSRLHLRAVSLEVCRAAPQAKVMLCIWQQADAALLAQLRVETVATTTSDALEASGKMAAWR